MNVIVKMGGVVTLPDEVVDELDLEPGSEIEFARSPAGGFIVGRARTGDQPSREQIRNQVRAAAVTARGGTRPEFADMTTDEFMAFIRG
jgi:antitoxin component of MazEF toxin-antitoxin module